MKHPKFILLLVMIVTGKIFAQEVTQSLAPFDKIVVSPKINVILQKGDKESITIQYANINEEEINLEIRHNKLHVFLDGSKLFPKQEKRREGSYTYKKDKYNNAIITAFITYRELKSLEVRGEEEVTVEDAITSEKFKLKAYGTAEIQIASLTTGKFKAKLYGENRLKIKDGEIKSQKYKLFGENKINTEAIESQTITSTIYGEGLVRVKASEEMRLTSFGDPNIQLSGSADLTHRIVIGNPRIRTGAQ
ncbi:MAG TPA: DUF2807 domain-containing protein [Cyclobacteriaceae bacterium]